jgi:hypothetical protein
MFILYAIVVGLAIGLLAGGRPARLGDIKFRWSWLFFAGLAVQVVLFSDAVAEAIGAFGVTVYVLSTAAVAAAVVVNWRIPGIPLIALGAASNLTAILANGGYMPSSAAALAALGRTVKPGYSNSSFVSDPALAPLTDIFALPSWLPWTNVFSIGDVLIAIGVVVVMVTAMRRPSPVELGAA